MNNNKNALIIVDVQNDFCPGGSLAVNEGDKIVSVINSLRSNHKWDLIVLTQDWHPTGHSSFASSYENEKPFTVFEKHADGPQMLWPDHCVQGSTGSEFRSDLDRSDSDIVVQKGMNIAHDSYSGFQDNAGGEKTDMEKVLNSKGITDTWCTGLALDYCVGYTAKDSNTAGFKTHLIIDATRGIDPEGCKKMIEECKQAGIDIIEKSSDVKLV